MSSHPTCILLTGMSHSGSRLLVRMFDKHPYVTTALPILKQQAEFAPLHEFFLAALDRTPLHSEEYVVDRDELFFILDTYMGAMDASKPYCVVKMPYHPLNCLDLFVEYFGGRIILLFIQRPIQKIVDSFVKRGEDKLFFFQNTRETIRQIKYLGLKERQYFLVNVNAEAIFQAQTARCDYLRDQWNQAHPEHAFITVDIEQAATSRRYLVDLLDKLGLSTSPVDTMMAIVDEDRLLQHKETNGRHPRNLKTFARGLTPPILWALASKLKNQL